MLRTVFLFLIFILGTNIVSAQWQANYDEDKMPAYKLPDPLVMFNGKKVRTIKKWENKRRPELLNFFTENIYGEVPGDLNIHSVSVREESDEALNGKAIRKQVELTFEKHNKKHRFTILIYLPVDRVSFPLVVGYNFYGNHTITDDVNVLISEAWVADNPSFGIINNRLTEQSRGVRTERWPVTKIIDAGIGLATIYYGEVDPDKDESFDGIQRLMYIDGQWQPADNEWGSIAAWAWGLRRAMDYFETDEDIDQTKVVVFGHSRLGKTALWAGANDQRFAGVISNNSGCGGAALFKREIGETIYRINTSFPHWFSGNFKNYNKKEKALPVDQNELIALIAPRPVYVASAEEDHWADPKGEFLATYYAGSVYQLYGITGIVQNKMPPVNQPLIGTVAYHIRSGEHDVNLYDWEQYLKWIKINIE